MNYYNYNVELPFHKGTITFREITTEEQLALAKANLSFPNVRSNMVEYFDFMIEIFKNCTKNKSDFNKINIVDFVLFLTKLRIVSISNEIKLVSDSDREDVDSVKTTLDLNYFLKNLYMGATNAMKSNIIVENEIKIQTKWPDLSSIVVFQDLFNKKLSQYETFFESYQEFVDFIEIKGKKIDFYNYTKEQKLEILDKLSISLVRRVKESILESIKILINTDLFGVESFKDQNFNFYNLSFVDFIRLFYSYDIKTLFQEVCYLAMNGISEQYTLNLSPVERKIHLNIIEAAKKPKNKEDNYNFDKIDKGSSQSIEELGVEFGEEMPN